MRQRLEGVCLQLYSEKNTLFPFYTVLSQHPLSGENSVYSRLTNTEIRGIELKQRNRMIHKILTHTAFILSTVTLAPAVAADTLILHVSNFIASEGQVMLQVFSSEAEFDTADPTVALIQRAHKGTMTFQFALPAGNYAARLMHDRNGNGELDTNFVGIPKEPWAFSNNASGVLGPAKWQQAKFELAGETVLNIPISD